jgi:hypothetical protein
VQRLASVLILCLALTACGKSAEEKYEEGFPPINRGLTALGDDVGRGLQTSTDAELAGEFGGFARRLGELRRRLSGLEPPGPLEHDHDQTLAAISAVRSALAAIAEAAKRGDAAAARDAATSLVREGAGLDEARARLARAVRGL